MRVKTVCLILACLVAGGSLLADEPLQSLSFQDAPLDQVVELYREWTDRILIVQASLSAKVTLKGRRLTRDEAKQAIETVLAMNGIALVPMGDKFLKVVNIANARQEGMELTPFDPGESYTQADRLISQVIPLRYVIYSDVQPVIQHLMHGYGKVQYLERVNSLLVTDTSANIDRIVEVLETLDQPVEAIEPRIYQLKYAKAGTVGGKIRELVEAVKTKKDEQARVARTVKAPAGVIRAPKTGGPALTAEAPEADTVIQGDVKIVSDDRTNILIIFSKAANFEFFDRIIKVLDVPVDPEVIVEVVNLEYAEASEISGILNEFIGAAKESEKTQSVTGEEGGAGRTIEETVRARTGPVPVALSKEAESAIGRLSADTKILSDERTNSLLLMGRKSDIEALKAVIANLDVMLEQVMIEAVILSVNLGDNFSTGIQWVYNSVKGTNSSQHLAGFSASGLPNVGTNSILSSFGKSALSYYTTFPEINISALISAAKSDDNARILSTPVVLTTDNTEAKITVAEERPVITSSVTGTSSTSARSTYEYRTIGIDLTVTPHINPQRFVLMDIAQSADDVGGNVTVDGNEVPIISKREISATVAVQDRETIVLGGLVRNSKSRNASKIPILGDIPLLGWLFSSHTNSDDRQELVVLLTPYVLANPEEASREATRRLNASDAKNTLWPRGWSESPLRNEEPAEPDLKEKHGFFESIFDSDGEDNSVIYQAPATDTEQILKELGGE